MALITSVANISPATENGFFDAD